MKKIWKVSLAVILSFVLAACSTDSGVDTNKQESDSTGYPITIEHAFGQTVLDHKPERIATVSWGNQDVPLGFSLTSGSNFFRIGKLLILAKITAAIFFFSFVEKSLYSTFCGSDTLTL